MGLYVRPGGGLYAEEVLDEEVVALMFTVGFADGVMSARDDDELEGLIGLDEGVGNLHGAGRVNIIVELAHDEHEGALETIGILDVGAFDV